MLGLLGLALTDVAAPLSQRLSDTGSETPDVLFGDIVSAGTADHVDADARNDLKERLKNLVL